MKYKYLLFDMDGMLVDTSEGVFRCFAYALEKFDIIINDHSALKPVMGPPLSYSFKNFFGLSDADVTSAVQIYRTRYTEKGQFECRVFDGVEEMLQSLIQKGYHLCVATSKLESYATAMLERLGIQSYFEQIIGATADESISTKDQVIAEAIKRMQINDLSTAIMIGDRKYDIIGASKNEIDSFGVYMGCAETNEHEKEGATYVAHSIQELKDALLNF